MNIDRDYYKILGVEETASCEEIKLVYRRLAKRYHPDSRGGSKQAEEKFKEITEAYSVLGNAKKREEYDMLRKARLFDKGFHFSDAQQPRSKTKETSFTKEFQDLFSKLFNQSAAGKSTGGGFDHLWQKAKKSAGTRGKDLESEISISFEIATQGGETFIRTGRGKRIKLNIPPGTENGKRIKLKGQGGVSPDGGSDGDLFLTIKVLPSDEFERKGWDIYSDAYINIAEAVLGTTVSVKTIHGKRVKLKIPPGTSSGKLFRIPNMGISHDGKQGHHYVRVAIDVPDNLTEKQKSEFAAWAKKIGLIKR